MPILKRTVPRTVYEVPSLLSTAFVGEYEVPPEDCTVNAEGGGLYEPEFCTHLILRLADP